MKRWVAGCLGLGLGACAAPAQQVSVRPAQPLSVVKSTQEAPFAERASFTAAEPAGAVVWLHVPAPARDVPVLGQLTGMGTILDPTALLSKVLGPKIVSTVDLEQPVDLTLSLENEDQVMAYGLHSETAFAERTHSVFELEPIAAGRWRARAKHADDAAKLACEVWQGTAPAQARLICSENAAAIATQGAFFMSKAASSKNDVSAHAELPRAAMSYLIAQGTHQDKPDDEAKNASAQAGAKAGREMMEQFGKELSSLAWDITLRDSAVDIAEHMEFSTTETLAALIIAGQPPPHAAVPDAFWHLPASTDVAWYSEGADADRERAAWAPLAKQFIQDAKTDYEQKPRYWESIEQEFEALFFRGGPYVAAHGDDLPALGKALSGDLAPEKSAKSKAQLTRINAALGGWFLFGVKADSKTTLADMQRFVTLMNEHVPRRKDAKPETEDATNDHVDLTPLKKPGDLPKGTLHWVVRFDLNPKFVAPADGSSKPKTVSTRLHVIAMPQDDYVWLAFSADEASASSRLRGLLAAPPADTLGAKAELRALASRNFASFGFATLAAYAGLKASADTNTEVLASRRVLSAFSTLPGNGSTPIPFWAETAGQLTGPRSVTLNLRLAPDAIADLLQLAVANLDQ